MERLKGKKQIEQLFVTGNSVGAFPLRMVYLKSTDKHLVGVSVSKKHFKSAVDRNRIKRLLRVAVEKQLSVALDELDSKYCLMVLYVGKEMPESSPLKEQFEFLIKRFNKKERITLYF
jgi:ribonuclease P protein component